MLYSIVSYCWDRYSVHTHVWNLIWCMLCSISPLMLIESLIFECQLQNKIEATSVLKLALLKLRSKFKASKQSSPKHQNNCLKNFPKNNPWNCPKNCPKYCPNNQCTSSTCQSVSVFIVKRLRKRRKLKNNLCFVF